MLKKVLKYDLKSVYKVLIVFYILMLFFAITSKLVDVIFPSSTVFTIMVQILNGFCFGMAISVIINNFMRCWIRFKENLYGDESYLTHTLPLSKNTLYLSKVLTAIITLLTSLVIGIITIFIIYYSKNNIEFIKNTLEQLANTFNTNVIIVTIVLILLFFAELLNIILLGYFGLVIGYRTNNHKIANSILAGFAIYSVSQIVMLLVFLIIGLFNKNIMNLFTSTSNVDYSSLKVLVVVGTIMYLAYAVVFYLAGNKLFNKGVNVE